MERNNPDNISEQMVQKHALRSSWTLWFMKNYTNRREAKKHWEENQNSVISFDTVEDFWACFNNIKMPSQLSAGCDYSLFRTGIKPMWEDPQNEFGGRLVILIDKKATPTIDLDKTWLNVLLVAIGESLDNENSKYVNGVVVCARSRCNKIAFMVEWECI